MSRVRWFDYIEEYLRCGILAAGFARVCCGDCGPERLVASSCQFRGVCPSCQQKRAEILCRYVIDEVIEPVVGHRQLAYVLPRHLRRPFYRDRKLLSVRLRDEILGREHSSFSVDGSVKVALGGYGRLQRLVRYMARPAVSVERHGHRAQLEEGAWHPPVVALQVPPPGVQPGSLLR